MNYREKGSRDQGAVSIFIVIFFALLIGVITMSFIGIVIRGSIQSTNNDLSRSAYDSAQAGVEDAKRAIALTTNACNTGAASCTSYTNYLNNTSCLALPSFSSALGMSTDRVSGTEVKVQSSGNEGFDQAYTCVNIVMDTPDYVNKEQEYQSDIIPLKSTGAPADTVQIEWGTHSDLNLTDTDNYDLRPNCSGSTCKLPRQGNWSTKTPAMMRLELISYSGALTDANLQSSLRTIFLVPAAGGLSDVSFDLNGQPPSATRPAPIVGANCSTTGQFACKVNVGLGAAVGTTSFLRVTPVYKTATFQLHLKAGTSNVLFDGVQPAIDSTGRSNDLFRRVETRVRLQNNVLYPEYALDVKNDLCKDYSVGSEQGDFDNGCN